jgi:hypothetical protein
MKIEKTNIGTLNNNWGNIRVSKNKWVGKLPTTNAFEKFETVAHGIRAMILLLQTFTKRNALTIRQLITIYAPPIENNTNHYVDFVSKQSGILPDVNFEKTKENLYKIIKAMVKIETQNDLPVSVFQTAWNMANTSFFDKFKVVASQSGIIIYLILGISLIFIFKK